MNTLKAVSRSVVLLVAAFLAGSGAQAAPRSATQNGNWSDANTWGGSALNAGDDVIVGSSRTVTADVSSVWLTSFTNAGTLVFSGTSTALNATNMFIGGTVTHIVNTASNVPWVPDGRVWLVCSNFYLATNGSINVDGKGYTSAGASATYVAGYGPGGGARLNGGSYSGGAAYGGAGARDSANTNGLPYGQPDQPFDPGSGGGVGWGALGGVGGGAVRIAASGSVVLNGMISASGTTTQASGGSGGAIWITCNTFAASNGVLSANGGGGTHTTYGCGGGGGRIAVSYDTAAQAAANLSAKPVLTVSANQGATACPAPVRSRPGTLWFPDTGFFPSSSMQGGQINISGFTSWSPGSLTVINGLLVFTNQFCLGVSNDLTIAGAGGGLEFTNGQLSVGGNLTVNSGTLTLFSDPANVSTVLVVGVFSVTNGGGVSVYSGATNNPTQDYGALVVVSNDLRVAAGSWVYPYSHGTNGGSVKFMMRNLSIDAAGGFDATGAGFWGGDPAANPPAPGFGPGKGQRAGGNSGGGGYGGVGGGGVGYGGVTNGSLMYPLGPGSGGSGGWGGTMQGKAGGGLIRLYVARTATINGTLKANGNASISGGSGGGIYLECQTLAGMNATNQANGGNGGGASHQSGGGGGRIAIWRIPELQTANTNTWSFQALGAINSGTATQSGSNGTVYIGDLPLSWPLIDNQPVGTVALDSVQANGTLTSTGTEAAVVSVFWGTTDGTNNPAQWAYTNTFPGVYGVQTFSTNLAIPTPGLYYYRYYAMNSHGEDWATNSVVFLAGQVMLEATDPFASEDGPDPGTFTIRRPAGMTNAPITVAYSIGGTASNGTDYVGLTGTATILAGATNTTITVSPIFDQWVTTTQTVVLTLLPGPYVIGPMNVATVSIANLVFTPGVNVAVSNGDWNTSSIWSQRRPPMDGDDVLTTGIVTIAQSSALLHSFTNRGTLTFSGTNTVLTAVNMVIAGTVTHIVNTNSSAPWVPNGRVWLSCSNLFLATNGAINVDGKGYTSSPGSGDAYAPGYGPGGGARLSQCSGGGAYGGAGAKESANVYGLPYGLADQPFDPGSGGGVGWGSQGGVGGGAVRIAASGNVVLNGPISANGTTTAASGGSGGAIWIACRTLAATNGVLSANGGDGTAGSYGAGGGGGRIAVSYDATAQAVINASAKPVLTVSANAGATATTYASVRSRPGSLWFTDSGFFPGMVLQGGQIVTPGFTAWAPGSLSVSSGLVVFANGFQLSVATNLTITGAAAGLELTNGLLSVGGDLTVNAGLLSDWAPLTGVASVSVGGNLTLTNGGTAHLYAAPTNGVIPCGALVTVGGDLVTAANSWIYPHSDPTNGGSVWFQVQNLTTRSGGGIDAGGLGFGGTITANDQYARGFGPGGGQRIGEQSGGGGYGGLGGGASPRGGAIYGATNTPLLAGSGGGGGWSAQGGNGGGVIYVTARGTIAVDGTLSANGGSTTSGGSGGSIYLRCRRLVGATGIVRADGGAGLNTTYGAGGGGGRIAIWCELNLASTNTWTLSVAGGGYSAQVTTGQVGTVYFGVFTGTVFLLQ